MKEKVYLDPLLYEDRSLRSKIFRGYSNEGYTRYVNFIQHFYSSIQKKELNFRFKCKLG